MKLLKKSLVMDNASSFIRIYDNTLEPDVCNYLIEIFENNLKNWERIDNNRKPNFTQLNLTSLVDTSEEINYINNYISTRMNSYKEDYINSFGQSYFPLDYSYEQFRIKKYNNDGKDAFDYHVDVMDHQSAKRFLSFFWYLNDVTEGGETMFWDYAIKPTQGRLVIFPPVWMFPHCGKEPISNSKYLLSTYLHYQ
jgi:prolyl 4-hydroxylase